jgi:hypothetical protein
MFFGKNPIKKDNKKEFRFIIVFHAIRNKRSLYFQRKRRGGKEKEK